MLSINGFIDNLMVGNIYHAGQVVDGIVLTGSMVKEMNEAATGGLAAAAQWWFYIASIGTFFTGAVGFFTAQYFNNGDLEKTQRSMTTKFQILTFMTLPVAVCALLIPEVFSAIWTHKGLSNSHVLLTPQGTINPAYTNYLGGQYIRIAAITWIIWIGIVPMNQSLRDVTSTQGGAIALTMTLIVHISLNFVFITKTNLGVEGPAYALLASRIVNLVVHIIYIHYKKLPISLFANPFIWDSEIYYKWIKRYSYLIYGIILTISNVFRMFFFSLFFQKEPGNNSEVDALVVLAVANAIQNIFIVAFDALQPLLAKYVSGHMGKNKMQEAKAYADRIIGFGIILSVGVSILLAIVASTLPLYGHMIWNYNDATLKQVSLCILVVLVFYPLLVTSGVMKSAMVSGSRATLVSWIDGVENILQTLWIVGIGLIQKYTHAFENFSLAYFAFYIANLLMFPTIAIPFYKLEWTKNHTLHETIHFHIRHPKTKEA